MPDSDPVTGPPAPGSGLVVTELGAVDLVAVRLAGPDRRRPGLWRVVGRRTAHVLVRLVRADLDRTGETGSSPRVDVDALVRLAENLAEPGSR